MTTTQQQKNDSLNYGKIISVNGFSTTKTFQVPTAVNAITPPIEQILIKSQGHHQTKNENEIYIFYNQPKSGSAYVPIMQRLLPLNQKWKYTFDELKWPTNKLPQVVGSKKLTLQALIREYLFVSLFKACAESLASENSSRWAAIQWAEKSIEELLDELSHKHDSLRQSSN